MAQSRRSHQQHTYRARVLAVIEATDTQLTGKQLAEITGLTYRQTVDALNALNNAAKIARIGRKFTARWCRVVPQPPIEDPMALVEDVFRSIIRSSRIEKD